MTEYASKSHTYRGYPIEPCEWAGNPHGGRWAIRTKHHTGTPWSDQDCPHAHTLAGARAIIADWHRYDEPEEPAN